MCGTRNKEIYFRIEQPRKVVLSTKNTKQFLANSFTQNSWIKYIRRWTVNGLLFLERLYQKSYNIDHGHIDRQAPWGDDVIRKMRCNPFIVTKSFNVWNIDLSEEEKVPQHELFRFYSKKGISTHSQILYTYFHVVWCSAEFFEQLLLRKKKCKCHLWNHFLLNKSINIEYYSFSLS